MRHNEYSKARIILADDHPIIRYAIRATIVSMDVGEIVGEAGSAEELFSLIKCVPCDLVVADYVMPNPKGDDGLKMVKRMSETYPNISMVIMTALRNRALLEMSLSYGAKGWVEKSDAHAELVMAIREVMAGRIYISKRLRKTIGDAVQYTFEDRRRQLTTAERDILGLVVYESLPLKDIAGRLSCTYKVVSRYKRTALSKLGLVNDQELYEYCRWCNLRDETA